MSVPGPTRVRISLSSLLSIHLLLLGLSQTRVVPSNYNANVRCSNLRGSIPPPQDAQRTQSVPGAGCSGSLEMEPDVAAVTVVQIPALIALPSLPQEGNRVLEPFVRLRAAGLKVVQGAQDVVVPVRRERQAHEHRLHDLARSV